MQVKMKTKDKKIPIYLIVMVCIFYYMRLQYLITTTKYDWIICFTSLIVTIIGSLMIFLFKKKKLLLQEYLTFFVVIFVGAWIGVYSYGLYVKAGEQKQVFTLQIDGYFTSRISGVLFTFEKCHFKRYHSVNKYVALYGEDFPEKCIIHLRVTNVLPKIYYIDNLSILSK